MPNISLDYIVILSRVNSVIYWRATPQPPNPRLHALLRRHASSPQPQRPRLHALPRRHALPMRHSFAPQFHAWVKARHTSFSDEEFRSRDVSGAVVGNIQHKFRWGDNTSFFRRHSREMQSKFPDTKIGPNRKHNYKSRYRTSASNELISR